MIIVCDLVVVLLLKGIIVRRYVCGKYVQSVKNIKHCGLSLNQKITNLAYIVTVNYVIVERKNKEE
jgi:hypothetical protein